MDLDTFKKVREERKTSLFRKSSEDFAWSEDALLEGEEKFYKRLDEGRGRGLLKSLSSYGHTGLFRGEVSRKSVELVKIQRFCYNLCRIHGLTPPFEIKFQDGLETAFTDHRKKVKRLVLGSTAFNDTSLSLDKIYEVYGGMALHETEHLLSSQEFLDWLDAGKSAFKRLETKGKLEFAAKKIFYNLLEDVRIEKIVVTKSPGYDEYLLSLRDYVFAKDLTKARKSWSTMTPRSKFLLVCVIALRVPNLLDEELKTFTEEGWCYYELLKLITDKISRFSDVRRIGDKLYEVYKSLSTPDELEESKKLDELMKTMDDILGSGEKSKKDKGEKDGKAGSKGPKKVSGGKPESSSGGSSEKKDSGKEERSSSVEDRGKDDSPERHEIDKAVEKIKTKSEEEKESKSLLDKLEKELAKEDAVEDTESSGRYARRSEDEVITKIEKKEKIVKAVEATKKDSKEGGFDLSSIGDFLEICDSIKGSFSKDERIAIQRLIDEKFELLSKDIECDVLLKDRKLAIKQPIPTTSDLVRGKEAVSIIQPFVKTAESVFQFRLASKIKRSVDMKEGRLFRKRLSHAMISDRLFFKEKSYSAIGMSICLLLDESGSMGCVETRSLRSTDLEHIDKATAAFLIATMFKEALKKVPKIDLHIYSHASFDSSGRGERDILVQHLYGGVRESDGISCYHHGYENYDHVAIRVVGNRFIDQAEYQKRFFLYLADGQPCGAGYGGHYANVEVKKEVTKLEKLGVMVLCIGIGGHDPRDMFRNSIKFTGNMRELVLEMKKIVSREVMKIGMEAVK